MASRLISGMRLDAPISHVLSARGIFTAKDFLCKPELELMELLDMPLELIKEAIDEISFSACPPYRSLCLMLCVSTALPKEHGGLDGNILYFDTELKFHSGRMAEIALSKFPHIYNNDDTLRKLATQVLVYQPHSLEDFITSLGELEVVLIENKVKLLIIDSIAALMQSDSAQDELSRKQNLLGHQAATLKYMAEAFRIPIVVTNQVRMNSSRRGSATRASFNEAAGPTFQDDSELQLTSALGTSWAHSVNIRLILESLSGQRFVKIAKSPVSAVTLHPYKVTSMGLELIGAEDHGQGGDVMRIHFDDVEATEGEDFEV